MAEVCFRPMDTLVHILDCTLLMHCATQPLRLGYVGATQDATDVYYICGLFGSMHPWIRSGTREWVRFDMSIMLLWPTPGVQSLRVHRPPKRRKGPKTRKEL